jgi:hypothetical protein
VADVRLMGTSGLCLKHGIVRNASGGMSIRDGSVMLIFWIK